MANLKMPYGKDLEENRLYHISQIPIENRGLKCGMNCVGCGSPLVARFRRKSKTFKPHFAHHGSTNCNMTEESLLHIYAKQVIFEEKFIWVPEVEVEHGRFSETVVRAQHLPFDTVELEKGYGGFIPDVTGIIQDIPVFIEILVTHEVDSDKLDKIKKAGVSTIEINLEELPRDSTREEILEAVCKNGYSRKWLYHSDYKKAQASVEKKEHQRQLAENHDVEQALTLLREVVFELYDLTDINDMSESLYERYRYQWLNESWLEDKTKEAKKIDPYKSAYRNTIRYPADAFIRINSVEADSHPYLWQACLYRDVVLEQAEFSVEDCIQSVTDSFQLKSKIKWDIVFADDVEHLRELGIFTMASAVRFYLELLEVRGYVAYLGNDRYVSKKNNRRILNVRSKYR